MSKLVTSEAFKRLPHHERLRQLGLGYLRSARSLCLELNQNRELLDWPRAAVVDHCFHHAIELSLKTCICYRTPGNVTGHDVANLKQRFRELYADDQRYGFNCPWDVRLRDCEDWSGNPRSGYFFDGANTDQVFRYFADRQGNPPKEIFAFAPEAWLIWLQRFEDDLGRIWSNILAEYPQA